MNIDPIGIGADYIRDSNIVEEKILNDKNR